MVDDEGGDRRFRIHHVALGQGDPDPAAGQQPEERRLVGELFQQPASGLTRVEPIVLPGFSNVKKTEASGTSRSVPN